VPGDIGEVARGAELRGRMHGPQCQRAHGIERQLLSHGDDAGLECDGQAAAGDPGEVGRCGEDHEGHEELAAGRKPADRHRRDAEDRADQLQRCAGAGRRHVRRLDAHRAVAGGIGIGEGVVVDVGIAVPGLPVERIAHHRVGTEHAADVGVVDPAVEVHQADVGEHLLAGEASDGLADDAVGRVIEGVVAETLKVPRKYCQVKMACSVPKSYNKHATALFFCEFPQFGQDLRLAGRCIESGTEVIEVPVLPCQFMLNKWVGEHNFLIYI